MLTKMGIKMSESNFAEMKKHVDASDALVSTLLTTENIERGREYYQNYVDDADDWRITKAGKRAARWVGDLF